MENENQSGSAGNAKLSEVIYKCGEGNCGYENTSEEVISDDGGNFFCSVCRSVIEDDLVISKEDI